MRKERILTYPINVYFKVYKFWVHFDLFQNHQSNIKNIFNNHIQKCYWFLFIIDIFQAIYLSQQKTGSHSFWWLANVWNSSSNFFFFTQMETEIVTICKRDRVWRSQLNIAQKVHKLMFQKELASYSKLVYISILTKIFKRTHHLS